MDNISDIVNDLLKNPPSMQLEELKNESVYNFGKAGEVAAEQILDILEKQKNT